MQTLTPADVEHFLARGYVTIPGCFNHTFAQPLIDHAFERMGYAPDDPATWTEPIRYLDHAHKFLIKDLCPKAWGAKGTVSPQQGNLSRNVNGIV